MDDPKRLNYSYSHAACCKTGDTHRGAISNFIIESLLFSVLSWNCGIDGMGWIHHFSPCHCGKRKKMNFAVAVCVCLLCVSMVRWMRSKRYEFQRIHLSFAFCNLFSNHPPPPLSPRSPGHTICDCIYCVFEIKMSQRDNEMNEYQNACTVELSDLSCQWTRPTDK